MNNELIQQARELCEKATPGPWIRGSGGLIYSDAGNGTGIAMSYRNGDADLCAASRTLVPQLCDALEAAQKELQEFKKIGVTAAGIEELYDSYTRENAELTASAEKAEAENRWIPVSEQLPQTNGCYLVYRPKMGNGNNTAICYFDGSHTSSTWHDNYGVDFTRILQPNDVTHWRPLPDPPEGERAWRG